MKRKVYREIIRNSEIPYLIVNCKKDAEYKYKEIEVLEESKKFRQTLQLLLNNDSLHDKKTEYLINNWIKNNFVSYEFDKLIKYTISTNCTKLEPIIKDKKGQSHKIIVNLYYLEDCFMILLENINIKSNLSKDLINNENICEAKIDFFANLSHELRTPINLISTTAQLMKLNLTKLSQQDANIFYKFIEIMEINSLRLVRLINNVIDTNKIDLGFAKFNPSNADIIRFIEDICDSISDFAESNHEHLIFDTNEEECIVLFDSNIIERVMLNLLSNAVKFNKEDGTIYVDLNIEEEFITIKVKDEGRGIPKDKIDSVFDRFKQVQDNDNISRQGSGIGLYLVKMLVNLHGGSIEVTSKINEGSEFIVKIPKRNLCAKEPILKEIGDKYNRVNIEFSDV